MKLIIVLSILLLFAGNFAYGQTQSTLKIIANDDAYVVNDFNDPLDKLGLTELKTGDATFFKLLYSHNGTGKNENVLSIAFLKFDLTDIDKQSVSNAKLKLYPYNANFTDHDKQILVHYVNDDNWDENDITFSNKPDIRNKLSTGSISEINNWAEWDLTQAVKAKTGPQMSLALFFASENVNDVEQVVFYSKEYSNETFWPHLEIEYLTTPPTDTIIETTEQDDNSTLLIIIGGFTAAAVGVVTLFYILQNKKHQKLSDTET